MVEVEREALPDNRPVSSSEHKLWPRINLLCGFCPCKLMMVRVITIENPTWRN